MVFQQAEKRMGGRIGFQIEYLAEQRLGGIKAHVEYNIFFAGGKSIWVDTI